MYYSVTSTKHNLIEVVYPQTKGIDLENDLYQIYPDC